MRLPPRTMHRAVSQAPSSITTGFVMSAMSRRCACDPVVMNAPCEMTASAPMLNWSWLCSHTSSPIQLRSPMVNFQGKRTRRRGRRMTPSPMRAPKATNMARRSLELTCQELLTNSTSTRPQAYTFHAGASQLSPEPGAAERSITGGSVTGRGYGLAASRAEPDRNEERLCRIQRISAGL